MASPSGVVTYLFTDIEGSTRLWEQDPARMQPALARHDAIARSAVADHRGTLVKMTGDGLHAAFDDPLDAVHAALALQIALDARDGAPGQSAAATAAVPEREEHAPHAADAAAADDAGGALRLKVRCGIHMGPGERRDGDFYGPEVNRAARIMAAAHGGQVLVTEAVAALVKGRLADGVAFRELGELRLRDIAATARVFQLVHAALRSDFPPLRALAATPTNLPQQLTSFVGRERELAEVVALLRRARLTTLVGPGGIGKTRLSQQAAAAVLDDFPDGVFFVEFAPIADARMLAQAVASVLGVKEEAGKPVLDALTRHLADRRALLIFDNCEHLLQGCADLATTLLRGGAAVVIVASSREALGIRGEQAFAVPALSLPEGVDGLGGPLQTGAPSPPREGAASRRFVAEALRHSEAARLFIARAVAARADFEADADDGMAIAAICRRLDGIPLAIELAAARTRTMPVTRIAERLSDRFRLLTGGDRSALPRQQTLRALIDWSHDLLAPRERALLRRLAVFAGGFTREAAETVAALEDAEAGDIEDTLLQLTEKSLVSFDAQGARYRLLDTVRDYAAEKLAESAEDTAARDRHLEWMIATVASAAAALAGGSQREAIDLLDAERQNLLSAHRWCDRAGDGAARGMRLIEPTKLYWFMRGLFELGLAVSVEALSRGEAPGSERSRARLLLAAGQFASWMGRYDDALRHLDRGLALARALGDEALVGTMLQPLAMAELGHGDREAARAHVSEALAIVRRHGNASAIAAALNQVGQLDRMDGRAARAAAHFDEALQHARAAGDTGIAAVTMLNIAMVAVGEGRHAVAATMVAETLVIAEATGDRVCLMGTFDVASALAAARGEARMAAHFHGTADAMLSGIGGERDPVDAAFLATWLERARASLVSIAFDAAAEAAASRPMGDCVHELREWLARPAPAAQAR